MLTFEFTGVEGRMTESEVLTSGMVGKTVQLLFDDSWTSLSKTVVFRADGICRVVPFSMSPILIPEDVLLRPFRKLYVGVYGTDASGTLVIPTLMAEGPMIRYGADPTEDSTAEDLPAWKKLQDQIGDLNLLETVKKENLVAAINEVQAEVQQGGDSGLSKTAATLLIEILRHALFDSDQSDTIDALETALAAGTTDPETPEVTLSYITADYTGGSVPVGTDVYSLSGLTVTAHYSDGTSAAVTDYTIGGQIAVAGTNTLSIGYEGKFTTVSVTGEETEKTLTRITANYTGGSVPIGTDVSSLTPNLTVIAQFSDGTTNRVVGYGLSGTISNVGANEITVTYGGLTATFTVTVEETPSGDSNLVAFWDFTTGSWLDSVGNLEAVRSDDVAIDPSGAMLTSTASYIQIPIAPAESNRDENIIEIKFGQMNLTYANAALRLIMVGRGTQPQSVGMFYKNYWTHASATATEFTDVNMFSGQTVTVRHAGNEAQFYLGDQLICKIGPGYGPTYLSVGSSNSSVPGALVESITIRKEV